MNINGWRKAKVLQNDQPITNRDEGCNSEECCSCAAVTPQEKRKDYDTRKDVANALDPHKRKGGGIVDWNAEAGGGPHGVEYEVDAERDACGRYRESAPEERQVPFQNRIIQVRLHGN